MKKLFLFSILSILIFDPCQAQEVTAFKSKNRFIEWNFGVAFLNEANFPFPGTSVLWGTTYINKEDLIFEYEAGIAFPTLITGKVGIGKKLNNTKIVVGVRPFPLNYYVQSSFSDKENGYWIASIEINPGSNNRSSIATKAIFNFGYRWHLPPKKGVQTEKEIDIEF